VSKYYEKLMVDFMVEQLSTVIFVEFIDKQKYMLLL